MSAYETAGHSPAFVGDNNIPLLLLLLYVVGIVGKNKDTF